MFVQIDGWYGGGKGVLWSLLDSHSEVFVCPIHDFSFAKLLDQDNTKEWIKKKHSTELRQILAKSEYYKFEKVFYDGVIPIHISSDVHIDTPYCTDFYKFDQKFYKNLHKLEEWSVETIVEKLYEAFYKVHIKDINNYPKYYASMSHAGSYNLYKNIPSILPNMKSIVVKRGLKNIIATRTNRKERPGDLNDKQAFRVPFDRITNSGEVENICHYFSTYEKLQERYPEQFMIVEFDDLVKDTKNSMQKVAKFLDIEYEEILSKPTRDGVLLEHNGMSFIGEENDDYRKLLTQEEIGVIDRRIRLYKIHGQPFNVFSLKSWIKHIAIKYKTVIVKW
jgi:hypothetical protein